MRHHTLHLSCQLKEYAERHKPAANAGPSTPGAGTGMTAAKVA